MYMYNNKILRCYSEILNSKFLIQFSHGNYTKSKLGKSTTLIQVPLTSGLKSMIVKI
jgi:hypothetical protein